MYLRMIRGKWIVIREDKTEWSDTVHESVENVTVSVWMGFSGLESGRGGKGVSTGLLVGKPPGKLDGIERCEDEALSAAGVFV